MKKIMITLAILALGSSAMAQETVIPTKKYSVATNSFWSNWFFSVGGQYNAAYSSQEVHGLSGNPFTTTRGVFGFNAAIGKWFTPSIGLRTKFEGVWGKQVNTENDHHTYHYWNIHEDVMFNLSNMLCGYNEKRVWNFIPYAGVGVARNMSANTYDISYQAGLLNNFRLSKHFTLFVDVYANAIEGTQDITDFRYPDGWSGYKKSRSRHWDKMIGTAIGLTYNFNKTDWDQVPDVDALMAMNKEQMDALNAALKDQQDENARLREMLANQKPAETIEKVTTEYVVTTTSVFFNLNSSKIASRKDLVNVKEVAEYAKANNTKILVTGYADSKTGSASINRRLSEARAAAVANELVKMGVSRDNIITEAKGGVDTLSPFSYNRRATVKIAVE